MGCPCETRTSTCRSFATISSGLYRFLAITVLLDVKDIPQVGPLQWGRISETRTSTCRSFATISSGLYRFLAITVLLDVKDIPQVGPLQWGCIKQPSVRIPLLLFWLLLFVAYVIHSKHVTGTILNRFVSGGIGYPKNGHISVVRFALFYGLQGRPGQHR